jgi:hypothetical protein
VVTTDELHAAARRYAELGYPVFPCHPGTKIPATKHGFLDATVDPDVIDAWWAQTPAANVAIATAGLAVVDTDGTDNPWPGDPEKAADLAAAPLAVTPHNGTHRWYRQPPGKGWRCTESRLAPKVDTRADGGYAVVPPSVADGAAYRWAPGLALDDPPDQLPEPPEWLIDDLDRLAEGSDPPTVGDGAANTIPKGQRNATLARLAGAMRRVGMTGPEITASLIQVNRDRCQPSLPSGEVERIAASIARYEPDQVAVALAENHWDIMYAEPTAAAVETETDPGPTPDHLLHVPGFVDAVMTHTLATAPYPERTLAFAAALSLQAVLACRKVRDPADNRTSLYVVALANSGAGKDHPRKVNQRVLLAADLGQVIGDTFASGEGVEDRMYAHPVALFQTDEVDALMAKINAGREARHEGIMTVLLKMYTSANAVYPMRVKAGKEAGTIDQPCLCVFGTAIPKHFYEALSRKMLSNGFFARAVVLETGKRGRGQDVSTRPLPDEVVETAKWWAAFTPGANAGNLAAEHPTPMVVPLTPEAEELFRDYRRHADDRYAAAEDAGDGAGMAVWARAHEKARRLALVYACSENCREPVIGAETATWASSFADHQTKRMLFMAAGHVSETEFDARCKQIVDTLRQWQAKHGDAWMPYWQLSRRHPWTTREHDDVRTVLLNQELVEFTGVKTGGRGSRLYRLRSGRISEATAG